MSENTQFSTGAVRSGDANDVRLDLITPIGISEAISAGVEILEELGDEFEVNAQHGVEMALFHVYGFLGAPNRRAGDLSKAAWWAITAAGDEAKPDSNIQTIPELGGLGGFSNLSIAGVLEVAKAYAEGAKKYAPYNWEKGMPVSDLLNHAIRHQLLWLDNDNSEPHLGHAAWGYLAAIHSLALWPNLNTDLRKGDVFADLENADVAGFIERAEAGQAMAEEAKKRDEHQERLKEIRSLLDQPKVAEAIKKSELMRSIENVIKAGYFGLLNNVDAMHSSIGIKPDYQIGPVTVTTPVAGEDPCDSKGCGSCDCGGKTEVFPIGSGQFVIGPMTEERSASFAAEAERLGIAFYLFKQGG